MPVCFMTVALRIASTDNNVIMNFKNQENTKGVKN
jgi:hypothetical protein